MFVFIHNIFQFYIILELTKVKIFIFAIWKYLSLLSIDRLIIPTSRNLACLSKCGFLRVEWPILKLGYLNCVMHDWIWLVFIDSILITSNKTLLSYTLKFYFWWKVIHNKIVYVFSQLITRNHVSTNINLYIDSHDRVCVGPLITINTIICSTHTISFWFLYCIYIIYIIYLHNQHLILGVKRILDSWNIYEILCTIRKSICWASIFNFQVKF